MKRFEIEEQLNAKVKLKSWLIQKIWPYVKDFIIDMVWEFLEKKKEELKK